MGAPRTLLLRVLRRSQQHHGSAPRAPTTRSSWTRPTWSPATACLWCGCCGPWACEDASRVYGPDLTQLVLEAAAEAGTPGRILWRHGGRAGAAARVGPAAFSGTANRVSPRLRRFARSRDEEDARDHRGDSASPVRGFCLSGSAAPNKIAGCTRTRVACGP